MSCFKTWIQNVVDCVDQMKYSAPERSQNVTSERESDLALNSTPKRHHETAIWCVTRTCTNSTGSLTVETFRGQGHNSRRNSAAAAAAAAAVVAIHELFTQGQGTKRHLLMPGSRTCSERSQNVTRTQVDNDSQAKDSKMVDELARNLTRK